MAKRRGRRTRKKFPVWLVVILVIAAVLVVGVTLYLQKKNAPSTQTVDLRSYYKLAARTVTNDDGEATEIAEAAEDETAIVMNNEILDDRGLLRDGEVYLKYSFVKRRIDSRFYYDSINDWVLVTNALQTVQTVIGEKDYTIDGESASFEHPAAVWKGESLYLSREFVDKFSSAKISSFSDPARIVVNNKTGAVKKAEISKDTQIRENGGNKSGIVTDIPAGTSVTVLDEIEGWTKIMDERGYPGYVSSSAVTNIHDETMTSDYDEPEYTHITMKDPINMVWHGVFYFGQDMEIYNLGANMTGVNVVSPRWFNMDLSEDYVELLSNPEYMTFAHEQGWKVWGMVTDDLLDTESVMSILMNTYHRQTFIQAVMADATLEGLDGLNVDFEKINDDFGDDYIEFIRELSIECRKAGMVLSVDNYTPYSYNAAYHVDQQSQCCDYIVIMAYDHYVGSDEIGPNSSVDFLQEVMDVTLPQVDQTRLIIGLPFYSRYWTTGSDGSINGDVYSMYDAKEILETYGAEKKWSDIFGMTEATFETEAGQVHAWLEDADSIKAKLKFLKNYPIAGVSWWNLGQQTDDVWEVISKYY